MGMKSTLSGYPEWLPEDRIVEQQIIKTIQEKFELYGFAPVETRSVEPLAVILSKGETDKEIYTLRRLQAGQEEGNKGIGLHFDLTVPFARYVIENRNGLSFPFRRYQIQKAWRGERPGLGRFREFLQADIDIVDTRPLGIHSDIEIVQVMDEILSSLPIPTTRLHVNNRKLLEGFYLALGIEKTADVLRIVDKMDKIGTDKVLITLVDDLGIAPPIAQNCLCLGAIRTADPADLKKAVNELGMTHPLLEEGLSELCAILEKTALIETSNVIADLSIARGFDYYTGTVCEVKFVDFPKYPTIAAGGRYDNLVSDGKTVLPGMGMSIGITRILGVVLHEGLLTSSRKVPSAVMVALVSEDSREQSEKTARSVRSRGIPCEVFPHPLKYGRQIAYADNKGIPFVWFPDESGKSGGEVRDLRSREQIAADPDTWTPPQADLKIQVIWQPEKMTALLKNKTYVDLENE
jgi:histidyl-tRNA synthetase